MWSSFLIERGNLNIYFKIWPWKEKKENYSLKIHHRHIHGIHKTTFFLHIQQGLLVQSEISFISEFLFKLNLNYMKKCL